jgi:hypothetical protein
MRRDTEKYEGGGKARELLHALGARFSDDEGLENRKNVAAVVHHAREDVAQRGIALGFAMPLQEHRGRDLDIPAQFLGGMPAQEETVKEGRFPLWKVKVVLSFFRRVGGGQQGRVGYRLHELPKTERAVYRNFSRRQVLERKDRLIFEYGSAHLRKAVWAENTARLPY